MATGLRLRLAPLLNEVPGDSRRLADGARLSFEHFGRPPSQARANEKLSAKLTITIELIGSVRTEGEREKRVLAELAGEVEFLGGERKPRFTIESGLPAPIEDLSPDPAADASLQERVLRLGFDAQHFTPLREDQGTELIVLIDPKRFHYLEIGADLELSGQIEGSLGQNEVVDVFITPNNPPRIEDAVFVIQRDGQPVQDANVELEDGRGRKISRTTDAAGVVRARGRTGHPFSLVSVTEKKQELSVSRFEMDDADSAIA